MKTLIAALVFISTLAAHGGVTNITVTFKTEVAGVGTNSSSLKFQQDGTKKDALIVDGTVFAWKQYQATPPSGTVATNSLDVWLKDGTKDRLKGYADTKAALDNAVRAQKITALLTTQADALNAGDLSDLDAIIAKWTAQ